MKIIMPSPQKVWVATAHEKRPFSRGSNYSVLTGKNLVFWILAVVACKRWSRMEV